MTSLIQMKLYDVAVSAQKCADRIDKWRSDEKMKLYQELKRDLGEKRYFWSRKLKYTDDDLRKMANEDYAINVTYGRQKELCEEMISAYKMNPSGTIFLSTDESSGDGMNDEMIENAVIALAALRNVNQYAVSFSEGCYTIGDELRREVEKHLQVVEAIEIAKSIPVNSPDQEVLGSVCRDGGKCHHYCNDKCFRRKHCLTFSDYVGPWTYPQEKQNG